MEGAGFLLMAMRVPVGVQEYRALWNGFRRGTVARMELTGRREAPPVVRLREIRDRCLDEAAAPGFRFAPAGLRHLGFDERGNETRHCRGEVRHTADQMDGG